MPTTVTSSATWKTRDGKVLLISEMETSHIKNCISMLKRALNVGYDSMPYPPDDCSDAVYFACQSEEAHNLEIIEEIEYKIKIFEDELKRRNITI